MKREAGETLNEADRGNKLTNQLDGRSTCCSERIARDQRWTEFRQDEQS